MSKTVVAKKDTGVPAFLKKHEGPIRGSEQAGMEDIILPRLLLLQQLSPQLDEEAPEFIDGAKAGDMVNSLTGENYGKEVVIVPVYFAKEVVIWKKREKGGGFCGSFKTRKDASTALMSLEPPIEDYDIEDQVNQFSLILKEDGSVEQVVVSFNRTKLKTSRKLQSLIRLSGYDSFACKYKLSSVMEKSDLGRYYNYAVAPLGFVDEAVYREAEAVYESISSNVDRYKAHTVDEAGSAETTSSDF